MARLRNGNFTKSAFKKACVKGIELVHSSTYKYKQVMIGEFHRKSDGHVCYVRYDMTTNKFSMSCLGSNLCTYYKSVVRDALDFLVDNNYRFNRTLNKNAVMYGAN